MRRSNNSWSDHLFALDESALAVSPARRHAPPRGARAGYLTAPIVAVLTSVVVSVAVADSRAPVLMETFERVAQQAAEVEVAVPSLSSPAPAPAQAEPPPSVRPALQVVAVESIEALEFQDAALPPAGLDPANDPSSRVAATVEIG